MVNIPVDIDISEPSHLSPRQQQVLEGLKEGLSEKQLAVRLGISRHTVHVYVKALYRRYHVSSRSELLSYFLVRAERTILLLRTHLTAGRGGEQFTGQRIAPGAMLKSADSTQANLAIVA